MGNSIIVFIATYALVLPILFVAFTILRRQQWLYDIVEAIAGGVAVLALGKLAGSLIHSQRPFVILHIQPLIPHVADNSFPSDHLAATGLAVMYLLPHSRPLAIAGIIVAILLGTARIQAHLHWPIDVITGFAIGIIGMFVSHLVVRAFFPHLGSHQV